MAEFVFTSGEIEAVLQRIDEIDPPLSARERTVLLAMIDAVARAARIAVGQEATPLVEFLDQDALDQKGRVITESDELPGLVDEFRNSFSQGPSPIVSNIKIGPGFPCP
jgi:hypothetical protein